MKPSSIGSGMSAYSPASSEMPADSRMYPTPPRRRLLPTLGPAGPLALGPALPRMTIATWISATSPAPIITPCGMYCLLMSMPNRGSE